MAATFDGENLIITLDAPVDGVLNQSVQDDWYAQWKLWQLDGNLRYPPAFFDSFGGNALTPGIDAGAYFVFQNSLGWRIRAAEADQTIYVAGNIAPSDSTLPITIPTLGGHTAMFAGLQPVTQNIDTIKDSLEYSLFNNRVTVDILSSHSGTGSLVGTPKKPVNNIADAVLIAASYGFRRIDIKGDITLVSGDDVADMIIYGENAIQSIITVEAGADVTNAEFWEAHMTGSFDGGNIFRQCMINTVTAFSGFFKDCYFLELKTTVLTGDTVIWDSVSAAPNSTNAAIIDLGGSGNTLIGRNLSGPFKLINKTGTENVCMDFISGYLTLDSTITAGEVAVSGTVELSNNSTGTTTVASRALVQTAHMDRSVFINPELTDAGEGSQRRPFNNLATALDYAEAEGITRLSITADTTVTLDRQLKNFVIEGVGTPIIDCNGNNLDKSEFRHCHMRGSYTGIITVQESVLGSNFVLNGFFETCAVVADLTCVDGGNVLLENVFSMIPGLSRPTISMNGSGSSSLSIRNYSGGLIISDCNNAADAVTIEMSQGRLQLASSCTAGVISARGVTDFDDQSNGSTVDTTGLLDPGDLIITKIKATQAAALSA